jgi:AraC family transcriptional regulator
VIDQAVATDPGLQGSQPSALTMPRLIRSSKPLGWQDIEVQSYLELAQSDRWTESLSPDITVILLTQGVTDLAEYDCATCRGFQMRRGDMLLKPAAAALRVALPDVRWQTRSPEPIETLRLSLSYALFSRTIEELADRDPARIRLTALVGFQDQLLLHIGLGLARELEAPSTITPLYTQTAAHMLAAHLLRTYVTDQTPIKERYGGLSSQQMKQIADYVQARLTHSLTLEELAQHLGFSPYHFARLFRETASESPHQFVLRQRVERAKNLLKHGDLTLAEVAIESGFANQSHLTQMFRRYTGLTPKAYRKLG